MAPSPPNNAPTPGLQGTYGSPGSPAQSRGVESTPNGGAFAGTDGGGRSASELLLSEVAQLSAGYDSLRRRASGDGSHRARVFRFPTQSRPASPFVPRPASASRSHAPATSDFALPRALTLPRDEDKKPHVPPHRMSANQVSRIQQFRTPPALAAIIQPVPSPQPLHGPPPQPQPQPQPNTPPQQTQQTHTSPDRKREGEPAEPASRRAASPRESSQSSSQRGPAQQDSARASEAASPNKSSPEDSQPTKSPSHEPRLSQSAPDTTENQPGSDHNGSQFGLSSPANDASEYASSAAHSAETEPKDTSVSEVDRLMLIVREKQGAPGSDAQPSQNAQGQWRYKCPFDGCTKQFKQKAHLQTHVRSHTGERPFVCPFSECAKQFSQQCNLRAHIRAHTGERPFKCRVCGKGFSQQGNMRNHMLIHYNDHPVVCRLDGCERTFNQLGNLKAHQNAAHRATVHAFSLKLEAGTRVEEMAAEEQELFRHFCELYKNSNKGVKGRGKGTKSLRARTEPAHMRAETSPTDYARSPSQGPLHFVNSEHLEEGLLTPSTSATPSLSVRASPQNTASAAGRRQLQTHEPFSGSQMQGAVGQDTVGQHRPQRIDMQRMPPEEGLDADSPRLGSQEPHLMAPQTGLLDADHGRPQAKPLLRELSHSDVSQADASQSTQADASQGAQAGVSQDASQVGLLLAQPFKMEVPQTVRLPTEPLRGDGLPADLGQQPQYQQHVQTQPLDFQPPPQPQPQQPQQPPMFRQPMHMPMPFQPYGSQPYETVPPVQMHTMGPLQQQPQQFQAAQWPSAYMHQSSWDGRQAPSTGAMPAAPAEGQAFQYAVPAAPTSMQGFMPYMYQNGV